LEPTLFITNAYAQAASANPSTMSNLVNFLPIILMVVLMYFLMLRPQIKRQKEQKSMMEALAKGDEVITMGGIVGKITKVTDSYVSLEIASGVEIMTQKSAVSLLLPKGTIRAI
jgi:preprotein translocase subunit YajC